MSVCVCGGGVFVVVVDYDDDDDDDDAVSFFCFYSNLTIVHIITHTSKT